MAALFRNGQLTYDMESDIFITTPAFNLLPKAILAHENAMATGVDGNAATAYENFLKGAIAKLLFFAHVSDARATFEILHAKFPSEETRRGFNHYTRRKGG